MLNKIRTPLTLLYITSMGLFSLVIIGIIFAGLNWVLYIERSDEIKALTIAICDEQKNELIKHFYDANYRPGVILEDDRRDIRGQIFYCIYDNNKQLVKTDPPNAAFQAAVVDTINKWDEVSDDVRKETYILPDGQEVTLMMSAKRLYQGNNSIGTVYVGKDITAYEQIFHKMILWLILIYIIFWLMTAVIGYIMSGRVMKPIKDSIDRQREFFADASHELRTPLAILLASVEVVEEEGEKISVFSRQVLLDMKDEIHKTVKIVDNLLTLAHIDEKNIKLVREEFSLKSLAAQVIHSLSPLANAKNLKLCLEGEEAVNVVADRNLIKQVLFILIENGIKYTSEAGSVTVCLESLCSEHGKILKISVNDTGIGIEQDQKESIFERFYRVDKTRSKELGGVGLGLAIAKGIVECHGGTITVESEWGRGSRFIVLIPQRDNLE